MAEFTLRRRLPEDVLEYLLIPQLPDGLDDEDIVSFLESECDKYLGFLGPLIIDYIWQNEGFTLRPVKTKGEAPPHLYGTTNFGDNIDDEWFVVYLLYELSKNFPDLVIRASDNDEEFMLIEAADHLPGWLNPETAEKRVYIYRGQLHIIPMPEKPEDVSAFPLFTPTVEEAVGLVRNSTRNTTASDAIQEALNKRINRSGQSLDFWSRRGDMRAEDTDNFLHAVLLAAVVRRAGMDNVRTKMQENTHYANVYVPVTLAGLLKEKPALVSPAIQSFYYRDPLELKVCRTMNYFKPENMVITRVRFSRCLYAQLLQQKFQPDKRSGWVLPSPSNPKFKEQDLGMKLSHGFEILCSKCKDNQSGAQANNNLNANSDVRWARFLSSLQEKGYFKGEIEGSQLYKKLLEDAKRFFQSQLSDTEVSNSDIAREVINMLPTIDTDIGPWKRLEKTLPPSDDDSWLDLTPEALDELMKEAAGLQAQTQPDQLDLNKVAESMNTFVNKVSGLEGVEFPSRSGGKEDDGDGDMELDGTSFIHAMQKMFEFKDDDEGSSSDMSEYDWEENSDDDLGSPTKAAGTRPAAAAKKTSANKPPPPQRPNSKPNDKPATSSKPAERPSSKPPERPAKPPALPPKPPSRPARPSKRQDPEIEAIMEAMDRELAQTEVGKSFEREPPRPTPLKFQPPKTKAKPKHQNGAGASATAAHSNGASKLVSQPAKPVVPQRPSPPRPSAPPPPIPNQSAHDKDIDDEDDDFRPVNVDMNVVKNMLQSLQAQQGLPGPGTNILQSMGIFLPPGEDEKGGK